MLTVPAASTLHTGKDHWHVLLQARAIESQAYVLAAAQSGNHFASASLRPRADRRPWGCVIAQSGGEGEAVVVGTVDTDVIDRIRTQLPSLKNRRLP